MMKDGLETDPIEDDPNLAEIFKSVDIQARYELERREGENLHLLLGQLFEVDLIKQRILKRRYGIKWKTRAEMNPFTSFD